ncbi:hypothetical protein M422DRAFT_33823 [Sphaerobolus stellatus SS14]|uniref:Cytosolic iron-sulfur protein assembly protein 1 n=1 Tax=Sphaerobolus stellatus (strain SS14) TaxID=990650 RepID=A0A0C9U340_SPHS4|nr:hypothetical protein M422DRAFT_33823 [Sphaerobolus stellatus SS14]
MIQTNLIHNTHSDLICDAAYDFYGTRFATAGLDQRIKIWRLDEQTGEWSVEEEWKAHDAPISRLSWAHPQHGQFIASSSFDRTVRVWERAHPEPISSDLALNGIGAASSERWVERALLTEAKGSVRVVEWSPKGFGMKIATIATDNHLRLYECLESGTNTPNAPTSLLWSLIEDVDVLSLPLATSSPSTENSASGDLTPIPNSVEPTLAPPGAAGSTSPYLGSASLGATGSSTTRPGSGNREADGGWDLSWCKEGYWGEVCAVTCGTNGIVKIIHFPPGQRPRAVLFLDPSPSTSSAGGTRTPNSPRDQPGSYAYPRKEQQPVMYAVTTVAWAPSCGRSYHLVATGGRDGRVRIWKVRPPEKKEKDGDSDNEDGGEAMTPWTATVVADFDEHKSAIGRVAWNVTGTVLTSAGNDGRVRLWRSTFGNVWRPMGSLDVVQADDADGDAPMEE